MSRWAEVWGRRPLDPSRRGTLAQLPAADGMDTGYGDVGEDAWRALVARVGQRLGIGTGDRVYEAGCGAGAFLYPMLERGVAVGGLDRSSALVGFAQAAMPSAAFTVGEPRSLDTSGPWGDAMERKARRALVEAACRAARAESQAISGYSNAAFRFNVFAEVA